MTQLGNNLEQRVSYLENELDKVKKQLQSKNEVVEENSHWWLKVAGSTQEDLTFDESMELGKEWRKSQQ